MVKSSRKKYSHRVKQQKNIRRSIQRQLKSAKAKKARLLEVPPNDPDVRVESQTRSTWAEMGAAHQNEQQPKFEKNVYIYIDIFFSKHGWNLEKIVYIYINIFYENIGDVL